MLTIELREGHRWSDGEPFARSQWRNTIGAQGVEPLAETVRLWDLADRLVQQPLGIPESDAITTEIVEIHLETRLRIGTLGDIVEPFLFHNSLQNLQPLTAKTHDYHWVHPCRPQQWFIAE